MEGVDCEVLNTCARWLAAGHAVLLATVVRTWGSAPRPPGALLAVRADGCLVGSVSGGCIEDDLVERVRRGDIDPTRPSTTRYGVDAAEARRFGLPCGGTLELVLEPLGAASGIAALCKALADGRLVARSLDMTTGTVTLTGAHAAEGLAFDGTHLVTVHGPRYRMLVIGAGQLSRYLSAAAVGLGYRVIVCDPRESFVGEWNVPGTELLRTMPDDAVLALRLDARSAVIALTHDPKLDDLALMEALKTPAFYVGALGSRRNNAARRERLREFDLTDAELARLHGPAGLYIGSRTPPEIAISILAEITAAKNGVALPTAVQVAEAKAARERTVQFGT
jgi:xanthine dehydrogenase accessory factor